MKKTITLLFALTLISQNVDAQFLKRLFKKKANTERKAPTATNDPIDDALQTAMADINISADNSNNRNAFLGIPLGIKASRFEKQLLEQGFEESQAEEPQTARSYVFRGDVYGQPAVVTLAVSEMTGRVYAVDVEETSIYATAADVVQRTKMVRKHLVNTYGRGFVANGGEGYTIVTRLGTVDLHFERASIGGSYSVGFTIDDAKAYRMAYNEMSEREYEEMPREIVDGLAASLQHTDVVGLLVKLAQNRTLPKAQTVLRSYDYTLGKPNVRQQTASLKLDEYSADVTMLRRKQAITSISIVATDDAQLIAKDLKTYGFTTDDEIVFQQEKLVVTLTTDDDYRVVMKVK